MTDNWQSLADITARITHRLTPEPFSVTLQASLAAAVRLEAAKTGHAPETIIAEAVRFYVGDAA
jgi:hypothetical protein